MQYEINIKQYKKIQKHNINDSIIFNTRYRITLLY